MKINRKLLLAAALATAAPTGLLSYGALAQDDVEEIIVTGSHIRGTPENAELPVEVLRRADLEELGSPSMIELVRTLGASSGNIGETNQFTSGGQANEGMATVNLRGLGSARTLVLLNGRRHVSTNYFGTDLSFLPKVAIGRMEVLKDGAAATYGSDAIGGVVNFMTRSGFEGLEVNVSHQFIDGSDGDSEIGAIFGLSSGNISWMIAGEYKHRGELTVRDRDWALSNYADSPVAGWSSIGNPGTIIPKGPDEAPFYWLADPQCAALGGQVAFQCKFQYTFFDNLIEESDVYNGYTELQIDLENGHTFYAEAAYSDSDLPEWKTSPSYPPQSLLGNDRRVEVTHPGLIALWADNPVWAAATMPGGIQPVLTWSRMHGVGGQNGGLPQNSPRQTETTRLVAGFEGTIYNDSIDYDVSVSYSERDRYIGGHDMYVERMAFALEGLGGADCDNTNLANAGIGDCEYYNPFSNSIQVSAVNGAINPQYTAALGNSDELIDYMTAETWSRTVNELLVLDAVFSGLTGWQFPGGEAGFALGAQVRKEEFDYTLSDVADLTQNPCPFSDPESVTLGHVAALDCTNGGANSGTGPLAFLAGGFPASDDRSVWGIFGELALPLTDDLNMQLAVRYEDYGGDTGSTVDPKIGIHWQTPLEGLAFRASASTTFRGPSLASLSGRGTALSYVGPTFAFKAIDTVGAPDLEPESAFATNIGALFNAGNFSGSVDWWRFDFQDRLGVEDFTQIVNRYIALDCEGGGVGDGTAECTALQSHVFPILTPAAGIERVEVSWNNGTDLLSSGIDAKGQFEFGLDDTSIGWLNGSTLTLGANGTYILEHEADDFMSIDGYKLADGGDFVGFLNDGAPFTPLPQWKASVFATLDNGDHNIRYVARMTDSYTDTSPPSAAYATVDSHITHDLHYNYRWREDTRWSVSVFNVLDEDPPLASTDLNYDPFTHSAFGRMIKLSIVHSFY